MYMKENYFILDSLELVGIFMFCHILLLSLQVYNDQKYLSWANVKKIYRNFSHSYIFITALNWSFLFSSFPLDGLALNTTDLCVVNAFSHMRS